MYAADLNALQRALDNRKAAAEATELEDLEPTNYRYEIDPQRQDESTIMTVGQFRKLIREVGMSDLPSTIEHAASQLHHVEAEFVVLEPPERVLSAEAQGWKDTAAQAQRNSNFHRGLLLQVAEHLDYDEVRRQSDGGLVLDPLLLKIPDMVRDGLALVTAKGDG